MKRLIYRLLMVFALLTFSFVTYAQFAMDLLDTSKALGRNTRDELKRFEYIRIQGYIQPEYQIASAKGAQGYSGGNFAPNSNNRFLLRRGRLKIEYSKNDKLNRNMLHFVFQLDGTPNGVFIRDFFGRVWENKFELFAFTAGMFCRPYGFELNYSSAERESPERGRMSQILMQTERDLGVMVSFEKRKKTPSWRFIHIDLGIFNGQGLTGPSEFDSYKDLVAQVVLKPLKLSKNIFLTGGITLLDGGLVQTANATYQMKDVNGVTKFAADSITFVPGSKLPRLYYGGNAQLKIKSSWGWTQFRGEYWQGNQTGTSQSSATPGTIPLLSDGAYAPLYIRPFSGAFIYFLQNIINDKHQIGVKLDWYDPNTKVAGTQIGAPGTNFSKADIKYSTLGAGYIYYVNPNWKLTFWYEWVKNELTALPGFTSDVPDNVLTIRAQFRF